ncbi:NAD(P)H-binding protein [Gordonia sp. X0973]|uniref:NAD(P)-dependent oxidoreductase n=1 Tax=Gordonia sp. X0973 TaxID=2742602 RepID=UPI000F52BAF8|nr:NAD(P)H-binding protein [Gordonia sp. X0973]QKT08742.1 NAD(P)H-binding protein [Gordonia sp. X0973]
MARITVIGGTGYAGSNLVEQAAAAGHQVRSFSRTLPEHRVDGVDYVEGSILDADVQGQAVTDTDVVVSAISPRGEMAGRTRGAIGELAQRAESAGVRLGVVGGAGSLLVAPGGPTLASTPEFPAEVKAEATEMGEVLDDLRASDDNLDWFLVSPAAGFGAWAPGEATGKFRIGDDILLVDENGDSAISGPDLAKAIVDEIDNPQHRRRRFTVAY